MSNDCLEQSAENPGWLLYLQKNDLIEVPCPRHEIRDILIARNLLALDLHACNVPPLIDDKRECNYCYMSDICRLQGAVSLHNTIFVCDF